MKFLKRSVIFFTLSTHVFSMVHLKNPEINELPSGFYVQYNDLFIIDCEINEEICEEIKTSPNVSKALVSGCAIPRADLLFSIPKKWERIRFLTIQNSNLNSKSCKYIARVNFNEIWLDLNDNNIEDIGVDHLSKTKASISNLFLTKNYLNGLSYKPLNKIKNINQTNLWIRGQKKPSFEISEFWQGLVLSKIKISSPSFSYLNDQTKKNLTEAGMVKGTFN
jgi:hypothetical protein